MKLFIVIKINGLYNTFIAILMVHIYQITIVKEAERVEEYSLHRLYTLHPNYLESLVLKSVRTFQEDILLYIQEHSEDMVYVQCYFLKTSKKDKV